MYGDISERPADAKTAHSLFLTDFVEHMCCGGSDPLARFAQSLEQRLFAGACLGLVIVAPAHQRGQGHEDGLGAAVGLESKQGSPVVDQIELDVAAAP